MKLFRVDMVVYATAYVRAEDFRDAAAKIAKLRDCTLHVRDAAATEVPISGVPYDDPELPEVSFAPVMTVAHAAGDIIEVAP